MNPNTFYAETFVDALARAGLDAVCIAPGSRSTPLTLSFAKHEGIKKYTHLDERSAAFFALGMAMASDKPVAMVCTSGTAAANFFPAIIEANMSRVPLLVLTADRPHELRHSGANQTIDQVKLYGDHVLWSVDMALPEVNPPDVAVRNLRTMAARALATADGRMEFRRKGVVHLNFPFRKPLEPEKEVFWSEKDIHQPILMNREAIETGELEPSFSQVNEFMYLIENYRNGIIVCGTGHRSQSVIDLGQKTGYPIFADPLSGTRYTGKSDDVISTYETFLQHHEPSRGIDVIIRFGSVPASKWLNQYITSHRPKQYIHVDSTGIWADDTQLVDWYISAPEHALSDIIDYELRQNTPVPLEKNPLGEEIKNLNELTIAVIKSKITETFFDAAAIYSTWEHLPNGSSVFVGNSNSIRHIDQFVPASEKVVEVYASRGASGIDGQVST
ncbi:MAG: 2-succinyl-5-enolpyruvyl-6-hydroxy-3-cyclohexene-1-carboxylic-acid synthase, partial [Chloroflexota bacterium]